MFILSWPYLIVIRLLFIIAGLFVVPTALHKRKKARSVSDGREIVVLPEWAWYWSNDFDGALGDKRGWWDKNAPFGLPATHVFSMFWWLAIRNPANNLRNTMMFSCPVADCLVTFAGAHTVEDKPGKGGWQFVTAHHEDSWRKWHGFYWVHEWNKKRALVVRLGFKIKPSHDAVFDEPSKGFTVRFNPWKSI